jgi:heptosyltransferase I
MRLSRYDLLLSLAHSEEALMMAALSGARTKAGFRHAPWDMCLDVRERIEGHNGWYNNARLLKRLGIACTKDDYVGLLPVERGHCGVELPEHFAVYSPGASSRRQTKTWEDEKFAGLMSRVWGSYGMAPVLVGGSDTRATTSRIIEHLAACDPQAARAATDLSGRLGLRALCSLLQDARLFAGIDSGVMHLAACMDVPLVALFGPSDPRYVGPHNRRSIVVREDSLACVPCYLKPCAERTCMRQLEIDTAFAACRKLLGRPAAEDAVSPEPVRDR